MSGLGPGARAAAGGGSLSWSLDARRRQRQLHYVDLARVVSALLLIGSGVLMVGFAEGTWWEADRISTALTSPVQLQDVGVDYNVGGSITCWVYGSWPPRATPCLNVSDHVEGSLGEAYSVVDVLLHLFGAFGIVAGALVLLGILGRSFGRLQFTLAILLALATAVGGFALAGGTALAGSGSQAATYCLYYSANTTNCPGFFGSVTAGVMQGGCLSCANTMYWGPGLAWYLTVGAGGLALLAWFLLYRRREGPFTQAEHLAWAAHNIPYELRGGGPSGPAAPGGKSAIPYSEASRARWTCPVCQATNSPWAPRCGRCRRPRPASPPPRGGTV